MIRPFHGMRSREAHVPPSPSESFLTDLAVNGNVAAATQNTHILQQVARTFRISAFDFHPFTEVTICYEPEGVDCLRFGLAPAQISLRGPDLGTDIEKLGEECQIKGLFQERDA